MEFATAWDNDWVQARHEASHALAYMVHGLDFTTLDVDEGRTSTEPRQMMPTTAGRVSAAGMVMDLRWMIERNDVLAGIDYMVNAWSEGVDYALECALDGEPIESDDRTHSAGQLRDGVPWAWAFSMQNRELIEAVGSIAQARRRLTFEQVSQALDGHEPEWPSDDRLAAAEEMFEPWREPLAAIDATVLRLRSIIGGL